MTKKQRDLLDGAIWKLERAKSILMDFHNLKSEWLNLAIKNLLKLKKQLHRKNRRTGK